MNEGQRTKRNINPHKEAVVAMSLWSAEYAPGGLGSMDFWDQLNDAMKRRCRDLVDRIEAAPKRARGNF